MDVFFALDVAASEFFDEKKNVYTLKTEGIEMDSTKWSEKITGIVNKYPVISIEDPFSEDDGRAGGSLAQI
jgi:enolase